MNGEKAHTVQGDKRSRSDGQFSYLLDSRQTLSTRLLRVNFRVTDVTCSSHHSVQNGRGVRARLGTRVVQNLDITVARVTVAKYAVESKLIKVRDTKNHNQ